MKRHTLYRNGKRIIKLYLSISLISLLIILLLFLSSKNTLEEELSRETSNDLTAFSNVFLEEISQLSTDIFLISDLLNVHDSLLINGQFTEFTSEEERDIIEAEFLVWLGMKQTYDQIRILDNTGQEIVRANYNEGSPYIVEEVDLQNKASRYYFSESIILDDRDLYMSVLDLNVENGEIELIENEPKPMLRVATPLFNKDGVKLGVVIVNYLASNLFEALDSSEGNNDGSIEIINENGYYLYAMDETVEFGFMYDDKIDEIFYKYHEHNIVSSTTGVVVSYEYENELYSVIILSGTELTHAANEADDEPLTIEFGTKEFIIFSEITLTKTSAYQSIRTLYLSLTIVVLIVAFIISRLIDESIHLSNENIKRIKFDSLNDLLTALPNRKNIYEHLQNQIQRKKKFTLLFIDFDGFKKINDTFGHDIGDEALIQGSLRIKNSIRFDDILGRIGGDEFIVILKDLTDKKIVTRVCNQINASFNDSFDLLGNTANMTLSIGAFSCDDNSLSVEEIISKSDKAMYEVKNSGKNSFLIYTNE